METKATVEESLETLDRIDHYTVIGYRLGIGLCGILLILMVFPQFHRVGENNLLPLLALASGLMASCAHIYIKFIRWCVVSATWLGLALYPMANFWFPHPLFYFFIHGLFYTTLCGVAFKEGLCFAIPGLKLTPLLLVMAVFAFWNAPLNFNVEWLNELYFPAQLGAGIFYCILAIAKLRMPLHCDIGDKSVYQV